MDAIIKQAVKEELSKQCQASASAISDLPTSDSSLSKRKPQTATRLSGLLKRIRNPLNSSSSASSSSKKIKSDKERRIQIRWIHYNSLTKEFEKVRTKNGGGNRYIAYNDRNPLTLREIEEKGSAFFFPGGFSSFAGPLGEMSLSVCNVQQIPIFEFPGDGTIASYLQENGLYASSTYLYLRSQAKKDDEFEPIAVLDHDMFDYNDDDGADDAFLFVPSISNSQVVCSKCSCTHTKGDDCIRCQQDKEYQETLEADAKKTSKEVVTTNDTIEISEDEPLPVEETRVEQQHLTIEELRQQRVAALGVSLLADTTGMQNDSIVSDMSDNIPSMFDNDRPDTVSDLPPC